ncbi:uncharacterized protein PG986_010873 [Apiospora aurea]|uniref:DUF202 domain-containing protein n=1 Tax=Apiospora aurea TaxID=335848 RepID=A0ABR1Q3M5_9PEZI
MAPWSRLATPVYKNTGSVARDHLASERTFLAWMRTGLGFVALGIAVERFSQLDLEDLVVVLRHGPHPQRQPPSSSSVTSAARGQKGEETKTTQRRRAKRRSLSFWWGRSWRGLFKPAFHGVALLGAAVAGLAGGVYGDTLKRRMRRERKDDEEP